MTRRARSNSPWPPTRRAPSTWRTSATRIRASGDRAGAEAVYRSALVSDPGAANALNGLGVLLVESGRPLDAIRLLERAAASAPDFWEARLNLGIAHQTAGNLDAASAAYQAVLAAAPGTSRERRAAAELLASIARQ